MIRPLLIGCALVAVAVGTACSGRGDSGSGAGEERERDLRETIDGAFQAFREGDIEAFYGHFADDFHSRCSEKDFREVMALARIFITGLDNIDLEVETISFKDDDHATANIFITGDGDETFSPTDDDDGFFDTWVREDGDWKTDIDDLEPCDLSFDVGDGSSSDNETPAPAGPGTSRDEAVSLGEAVRVGDLEATVLDADLDAAEAVQALSEFNDPARPGNRFVLVRMRVRHVGDGEETIQVSTSDIKLTGSRNVLYDNFGQASCGGFIEGELRGEMFSGGTLEGLVCFQIPRDEANLILVAQPFFSFDDGERRYLALE